jgi:hypothetical protein
MARKFCQTKLTESLSIGCDQRVGARTVPLLAFIEPGGARKLSVHARPQPFVAGATKGVRLDQPNICTAKSWRKPVLHLRFSAVE